MNLAHKYADLTRDEKEFLIHLLNFLRTGRYVDALLPQYSHCKATRNYPRMDEATLVFADYEKVSKILTQWLIHPRNGEWGKYYPASKSLIKKWGLKPDWSVLDSRESNKDVRKAYEDER